MDETIGNSLQCGRALWQELHACYETVQRTDALRRLSVQSSQLLLAHGGFENKCDQVAFPFPITTCH